MSPPVVVLRRSNQTLMTRIRLALTVSILLLPAALVPSTFAQSDPKRPKVIVVGFDGVDARFTERWMNEGKLPNLARLRAQGTFRPLLPTLPAQTPVSWSTFSTGIDPGRTGIFDFLRRDPKTYLPVFAAIEETTEPFLLGERNRWAAAGIAFLAIFLFSGLMLKIRLSWTTAVLVAAVPASLAAWGASAWTAEFIPTSRPAAVNRRQGIPMWDVVSARGLKSKIVHVPITFPATDLDHGQLLSGLGVPDISGRVGKPFYFTSELDLPGGGSNEFSIEVVQLEDNRGIIETEIVGPPNKLFAEPKFISTPMTLTVAEDRASVEIAVGQQKISLRPGEWSGWTDFEFEFNPFISVNGISRFYLLSVAPEVRLYLSPINFDPRSLPQGFRISSPAAWAPELAERFGPYKTIGWAIDTWAVSAGFATEQIFWDDMVWTVNQYRKMFREFLAEDNDLFVQCFEFPDRVGHVFWRAIDPSHPAYEADLAAKWGDSILKSYQIMDEIVGEAMEAAARTDATLIVLSDHGFASFRKAVNYNTWLVQNGYMGLREGVEAKERTLEILFDQGQFWENVDWSKTRAYALGLGEVYVNLAGREAQGIVKPGAEYDAIKLELATGLEAMVDPEDGARPVSRVVAREEIYESFDPNVMPDLFVTNTDGYRVSWQTSLGGVQRDLLEVNNEVWSGDHCSVDPELVKGILFVNRKLTTDRSPYIADVYATVLDVLGLEPPYKLDGVALR